MAARWGPQFSVVRDKQSRKVLRVAESAARELSREAKTRVVGALTRILDAGR